MHKTLHKKLTEKHICDHRSSASDQGHDGILRSSSIWPNPVFEQEMSMLREAAKDLLQPRPQAISKLLAMARNL